MHQDGRTFVATKVKNETKRVRVITRSRYNANAFCLFKSKKKSNILHFFFDCFLFLPAAKNPALRARVVEEVTTSHLINLNSIFFTNMAPRQRKDARGKFCLVFVMIFFVLN